jgi:hypothetical protein
MKINLLIQSLPTGTKNILSFSTALMVLASPNADSAESAPELMEKGIYAEETKGELSAATEIYQQIVDDPRADSL